MLRPSRLDGSAWNLRKYSPRRWVPQVRLGACPSIYADRASPRDFNATLVTQDTNLERTFKTPHAGQNRMRLNPLRNW